MVYYLYSSDIELVKTQIDFISNIHLNRKDMVKKYFELIDNKKTKRKIKIILKKILKNNNIKNNINNNQKTLFVSNLNKTELNKFTKLIYYKNICKYMGDAPANIYSTCYGYYVKKFR